MSIKITSDDLQNIFFTTPEPKEYSHKSLADLGKQTQIKGVQGVRGQYIQFRKQHLDVHPASWALLLLSICKYRASCVRRRPSVNGEDVALDLVAQLSLKVTQLLLEDGQRWHDDGFWPQRATGLHIIIEPVQEKCVELLTHSQLLAEILVIKKGDSYRFVYFHWFDSFHTFLAFQ